MNLRSIQQNWDKLGAADPLWAILNDVTKTGNRWQLDEFFSTGAREVQTVLDFVQRLHPLPDRRRALDFGCGVGRLTQALAEHFDEVDGVDISPTMLESARRHNRHGERCRYVLNSQPDLKIFPASHFTFIYSSITLQHIPARYAAPYVKEFLRVLAPDGVLVFQLPACLRKNLLSPIRMFLRALNYHLVHPLFRRGQPLIEMHPISKSAMIHLLESNGARIVDISPDHSAGAVWESYRYTVVRS